MYVLLHVCLLAYQPVCADYVTTQRNLEHPIYYVLEWNHAEIKQVDSLLLMKNHHKVLVSETFLLLRGHACDSEMDRLFIVLEWIFCTISNVHDKDITIYDISQPVNPHIQ